MNRHTTRNQERIGHAIDSGEQISVELLAQISEDPSLRRFHELSLQIASDLRLNANQWAHQNRSPKRDWDSLSADTFKSASGERNGISSFTTGEYTGLGRNPIVQVSQVNQRPRRMPATFLLVLTAVLALFAVGTTFVYLGSDLFTDAGIVNLSSIGEKSPELGTLSLQSTTESPPQPQWDAQSAPGDGTVRFEQAHFEQAQFEEFFYVTVESTFKTLQSISETLTERAVGKPLQRTIELATKSDPSASGDAPQSANHPRLEPRQIQLIRDFQQATDFLTETLPKEATQSWMEMSYAHSRSP